ncbi:MAG TPA: FAD-dependent oxidoreductase [Acidimicrobiia bacterium]|nr:FAD-dependent oxidoreductase [Acidimicrobiia bacterium]
MQRLDADVCVIGAGYAGLTAARRLRQHGRAVAVLEARDRVGGRIWTDQLADGTPVDRGGAWLAPRHDAIFALAREVGVDTYKTWVRGAHLLIDHGRIRRYHGLIPKISPRAIGGIALTQFRVDRLARQVPRDAPWDAPRAAEWDQRTVADWVERAPIPNGIGRELFEMAVRGLMTADLREVSLLHLLLLVHAHGGIEKLFSIKGGAQENMVHGGAGAIAQRIAADLGDAVRLGAPVRAVTQHHDRVEVAADDVTVVARHAILAVPPALTLEITFDPPLGTDRRALYQQSIAGPETKTLIVYDEPFWRADGFSGQTSEPGSASEVTLDASPASGNPGVIASFTFGPNADRLHALAPDARRKAVIDALTARLGARAARPVEVIETAWFTEPWTRGCSFAHLAPGALTQYGRLVREPFNRVHWAGTETATTSHGAIDGAVRSGERAAAEILDRT